MNASKHSRDGDAEVRCRIVHKAKGSRELILEVRDLGYDEADRNRHRGYGLGLTAMKERAGQIGADLFIKLDPGGSLVRVILALGTDNRKEQQWQEP
jgi:nitrate/nitrite-specific signal transduction histidine kinase